MKNSSANRSSTPAGKRPGGHSMRHTVFVLLLSITMVVGLACKKESAPQGSGATATPGTSASTTKHAPAQAAPGSHEDWCEEHQVPESMCTRCNPRLVAAFKATGDWCQEHGLPESQCRRCNSNLKIERPPQKRGQ